MKPSQTPCSNPQPNFRTTVARAIALLPSTICQRPVGRPSSRTGSTVQITNEESLARRIVGSVADVLSVQSHCGGSRRSLNAHDCDVGQGIAVHVATTEASCNIATLGFEIDEFRGVGLNGDSIVEVHARTALAWYQAE